MQDPARSGAEPMSSLRLAWCRVSGIRGWESSPCLLARALISIHQHGERQARSMRLGRGVLVAADGSATAGWLARRGCDPK